MTYSIGEVSEMLSIPISTLRYYDRKGLLPLVERTDSNIRIFSDMDVRWLNMIECLKNTGMELKEIKIFFQWCEEGDSTIDKRYEMFLERRRETQRQIALLQKSLDLINYKCEYYRIAKEAGTTNIHELNQDCKKEFEKQQLYQDAVVDTE